VTPVAAGSTGGDGFRQRIAAVKAISLSSPLLGRRSSESVQGRSLFGTATLPDTWITPSISGGASLNGMRFFQTFHVTDSAADSENVDGT